MSRGATNIDLDPYRDGGRLITTSEAAARMQMSKRKADHILKQLLKQGKLTRYPGPTWRNGKTMIMLDWREVDEQTAQYPFKQQRQKTAIDRTPPAGWVTPTQAAQLLGGISRQRVDQMIDRGELVSMAHPQLRRNTVVSVSSIRRLKQRRGHVQPETPTPSQQLEQAVLKLLVDGLDSRRDIASATESGPFKIDYILRRLMARGIVQKVAPGRYVLISDSEERQPAPPRPQTIGWKGRNKGRNVYLTEEELNTYLRARETGGSVPAGFWRGEAGESRAAACVRYVAEVIHDTNTRAEVISLAKHDFLRHEYLEGAHQGRSVYALFNAAFPEHHLMPWELGVSPGGYWKKGGDAAIVEAVRWCLKQLGKTAAEAAVMLDDNIGLAQIFVKYGLSVVISQHNIRYWLRQIDPTIPAAEPPGTRRLRREQRQSDMMPCPICGKRYVAMGVHVRRTHKLTMGELAATGSGAE